MFIDRRCPICGGAVTVDLGVVSSRDASLRFQCSKCRETAIYDITPEVEGFIDDFMAYLSERVKKIEGGK